jgi:glycosyltransferase involved in cell wall biosynthesis
MLTPPVISVVMSVLNGELFLAEAVESILNQTFEGFEFIIINDGSTDGTGAILGSYRKMDQRVRIVSQENRGLVRSLNLGCGMAQGKYIARMDADDIALKDRLQLQVDFLEKHPEPALLGGAVEIIDRLGDTLEIQKNPTGNQEIQSAFLRNGCPIWHPTVLMRREIFLGTGGYRQIVNGAEDHDLWLRIAEHHQLANLGTVVLKHRRHPDEVTVSTSRRCALSRVAALAAAAARRKGLADPLDSIDELTPESLASIGVSQTDRASAVMERYIRSTDTMCKSGRYKFALQVLKEAYSSPEWAHVDSRTASDLHLLEADALWHEGKYVRSIWKASRAFMLRPLVIARPLKPLLQR